MKSFLKIAALVPLTSLLIAMAFSQEPGKPEPGTPPRVTGQQLVVWSEAQKPEPLPAFVPIQTPQTDHNEQIPSLCAVSSTAAPPLPDSHSAKLATQTGCLPERYSAATTH